ncbi:MAG: PAS domain-containing protein [Actinomycetota bacterium]
MDLAGHVLHDAAIAGFIALGCVSVVHWRRHPDRQHRAVALAFGSLGALALVWVANDLIGYRSRTLVVAGVVALLASGYGLLLIRHTLVPVARRTRYAVLGAMLVAAVLYMMATPPLGREPRYDIAETAALWVLISVWAACAGEPIVSLYRTSRNRPAVQRSRLKTLSLGYAVLVGILLGYASTAPRGSVTGSSFGIALGSVLLLPLLWVAFAPPTFLRRLWRAAEEERLRHSLQRLLVETRDAATLGPHVVDWAIRLVGADGGFIVDPAGSIVQAVGVDPIAVADAVARRGDTWALTHVRGTPVLLVPLRTADGTGGLGVVGGRFAPVFGSDEVARLEQWAAATGVAFDRLRVLSALRDQTQRHERVLHAMSDVGEGVVIGSINRLVYVNEAYCQMVGYTESELLAMPNLLELVVEDDRAMVVENSRRRRAGLPLPQRYDLRLRRRDGGVLNVEVAVKPYEADAYQFIAVFRDITPRTLAVEALKESEGRYRTVAAQLREAQAIAAIGSWEWDIANNVVTWSDELYRIYGVDPTKFTASFEGFLDLVHPDDRAFARSVVEQALADRRAFLFDHRVIRPDGAVRTLQGRGEVISDATGAPVRMIGTGQDVTEQRQAEAALRSAYEREREALERLRKLDEMKSAILTAVSHELRTPLTVILGFAETLLHNDGATAAERVVFLRKIANNALKLDRLLFDLLDLDRLDRGILEPRRRATDLGALILRVAEQAAIAETHILTVDAPSLVIDVDGPRVERIVENLLVNAARHTPPGCRVWARLRAEADGATIIVDDEGPGVSSEHRSAIFEPFQQGPNTSAHSPGVGIGLSLVARFAALHDGRAWVEERPDGGASFRVHLPGQVYLDAEQPGIGTSGIRQVKAG